MCGATTPALPSAKRKFLVTEDDLCAKMARHGDQSLHFFVRNITDGTNVVVHLVDSDSVESLHQLLRKRTGVPIEDQCLVYRGKQLHWDRTLADYGIENDSCLQLVGRMRSCTGWHSLAWQHADTIMIGIKALLCDELNTSLIGHLRFCVKRFIMSTPDNAEKARDHLQVFNMVGAPGALVSLLSASPDDIQCRDCAEECIRFFLSPKLLPKSLHLHCAPILMSFCKFLYGLVPHRKLYQECRTSLGSFLEGTGYVHYVEDVNSSVLVQDLYPFVEELGAPLTAALSPFALSVSEVEDFVRFSVPLRRAIEDLWQDRIPIPAGKNLLSKSSEVEKHYKLFLDVLVGVDRCLQSVESLAVKERHSANSETFASGSELYLPVLRELLHTGKIYEGGEEKMMTILGLRRSAISFLVKHSAKALNHIWLLQHKQATNFETRRRLVLTMFPDIREEYDDMFEMLIDRNQFLTDSFEYIRSAGIEHLRGGLFVEFKNEDATGQGVLREWFFLLCQAMFNPENALFLSSQSDRRKFYPNPASGVNRLHLDYFGFCGRIVALALMHRMQVGVMFDRVFFLQLSGKSITLDDIQDADPVLYKSCKEILEYNPNFVDSDALGLTFSRNIEELGLRKVVELCPGGERIAVNSKNRNRYVDLLIEQRFVTSVSRQIRRFTQGFTDILSSPRFQKMFFQSLDLDDYNAMLYGSEKDISVEEWMAHTEYNGYKKTDCQIQWFWKIVEKMSSEQKRLLLYFWTSINYLPYDGFRALGSTLWIFKDLGSVDRMPSSHTCFYRLCLPSYPSICVMRKCLTAITQVNMCRSFGTW